MLEPERASGYVNREPESVQNGGIEITDPTPLKVIAFDPGITTGFALGEITDGLMKVRTGQSKWSVLDMWRELHSYKPGYVVYERFEYRNRAREGLELFSVQLIGVIELYDEIAHSPKTSTHRQQPGAVINGYFSNDKLKRDKLYKPGNIHANEACMHLLYWFTFGPGFQHNSRGYEPA